MIHFCTNYKRHKYLKYVTLFIMRFKNCILLIVVLFLFSCSKKKDEKKESLCTETGTLLNYLGQNNCNWVFDINGTIVQPTNLSDWGFTYIDGQVYDLSYIVVIGNPDCLLGDLVQLTCLHEK